MYSTCVHCNAALGANESIEAFPVGRRLAFDAAKGRLWVVCPRCARWNLTPLEERWEAIEECERAFRSTRMRLSTDNIGLAKLGEGLELVRIGQPQRPEMAAWRYAGDFRRRWLKYGAPLAVAGGVMSMMTFSSPLGWATQIGISVGVGGTAYAYSWIGQRVRTILPNGRVVRLNPRRNQRIRLCATDSGWGIAGHEIGGVASGPRAAYTYRSVLTSRNFKGGNKDDVSTALELLADVGDMSKFISRAARVIEREGVDPLPTHVGIALEMALHEDVERRALEGELAELRQEWILAEEIASIADNMLLPASVEAQLGE